MKKWLILGFVALTLTGCASNTLGEQEYYDLVHETEGLSGMDNDKIEAIGKTTCAVFESSEDAYALSLKNMLDGGIEAGDAGTLIALSVSQYCPEHIDDIPTQ